MTLLTNDYYEAQVLTDEIDPNHAGAVRVKILGITDDLDDDMQPYAFPLINGMQAVPTKGTFLHIKFDDGDIQRGRYFFSAQDKSFLPADYVDDYPNVAVTNLGGDTFILTHNRRTKTSVITHPSDSRITWSSTGAVTHESDKGYINAGYGAKNNQGEKVQAVLTEGTINPFTCRPFGNGISNGGAHQGSEYFFVTHISKATVDAINGQVVSDDETYTGNSAVEDGGTELVTYPLYNASGSQVDEVEYYPTESYIERTDKEITHIIIATTGSTDFVEASAKVVDSSTNYGCHYMIGRSSDSPDIDSARDGDSSVNDSGFLQFVEITNDVYFASNATIASSSDAANKNAVVIFLVGDGSSYTDYQYTMLNEVITHIKYSASDTGINIYTTDDLTATPSYETMNSFDKTRINS